MMNNDRDPSFATLNNVVAETNRVLNENQYQFHNDGNDFDDANLDESQNNEIIANVMSDADITVADTQGPEFKSPESVWITVSKFNIDLNKIGVPWELPAEPFNPSRFKQLPYRGCFPKFVKICYTAC